MTQASAVLNFIRNIFFPMFLLVYLILFPVQSRAEKNSFEHRMGGYRLINPLLECQDDESTFRLMLPFQEKLQKMIDRSYKKKASMVAVYFRDMNNGPWFGINEREDFSPASLLKVPLMMGYFHAAEDDPSLLTRQIKYESGEDLNSSEIIQPDQVISPGMAYTVDDLIYRMIVYSDNNAASLLFQNMSARLFSETYRDLGIEVPGVRNVTDFMNVAGYASFFRILFNASYLNKKYSEKALEYLTQVGFKDGLSAGVPSGIIVAHKFGERRLIVQEDPSNVTVQLHDCGIVYYPDRPYLLCVMTRGKSVDDLIGVIQGISRFVYEETDRQMRNK